MENSFVLKTVEFRRLGRATVTLQYGHRYRATYYTGKVLEFTYHGTPTYSKQTVWCDNVDGLRYGFCSEWMPDWTKVEEI